MAAAEKKYAYTTLITRASYLAGVVILAHTLKKQGSKYPLIVYYTTNLKPAAIKALKLEAPKINLILRPCELLLPAENVKTYLIAERFTDTWTKLRVFEDVYKYDAVCYLDADMAIFRNMDEVFERADGLPSDWIAANHACVCNLDKDPWAPDDWNVENCAYTPLSHPDALAHPTQQTPESRGTYHLLNSGMFLYRPSKDLWDNMLDYFHTSDRLSTYKFPDQDFLADFFRNKWRSLGWQYNALKTMRYIHPNIWRDDAVVCLHYIVDKPWASRVTADGIAGFKGKDGVTHAWWWDDYADWQKVRESEGATEVVEIMKQHIAKDDGSEDSDPDMKAIGSKVQAFANNKSPGGNENKQPGAADAGQGPAPNKALGERGHGPVVHPRGSSKMPP
jgi:inositol 3-alpha-galactosyltransferase